MWADSCWLLSDRPLYIPDFAERYIAVPALAVKAGRLGKGIPARFSLRYIGDWTAALIILPADILQDFRNGLPIDTALLSFDNAVVLGDWKKSGLIPAPLPPEPGAPGGAASMLPTAFKVIFEHGPDRSSLHGFPILNEEIASLNPGQWPETIRRISLTNVVKTGDIFLFPTSLTYPLDHDDSIRIYSLDNNTLLLTTRFK